MVPMEIIKHLQQLCRANPSEEQCGIIDSTNCIYRIQNVAHKPIRFRKFVFDKQEYFATLKTIKSLGRTVKCIFHTHPQGSPTPSKADCEYILKSKTDALIISVDSYHWVEFGGSDATH